MLRKRRRKFTPLIFYTFVYIYLCPNEKGGKYRTSVRERITSTFWPAIPVSLCPMFVFSFSFADSALVWQGGVAEQVVAVGGGRWSGGAQSAAGPLGQVRAHDGKSPAHGQRTGKNEAAFMPLLQLWISTKGTLCCTKELFVLTCWGGAEHGFDSVHLASEEDSLTHREHWPKKF